MFIASVPLIFFALLVIGFVVGLVLWLSNRSAGIAGAASDAPAGSMSCGRCGYLVKGLNQMSCPECGADFREAGIKPVATGGAAAKAGIALVTTTSILFVLMCGSAFFWLNVSSSPQKTIQTVPIQKLPHQAPSTRLQPTPAPASSSAENQAPTQDIEISEQDPTP